MLVRIWRYPDLYCGEGNGNPLQYSCLENPKDGLSDFTFTFHFHALEKEIATTPVFLPGESQGRGSLVGCCLWCCTESDTTEANQQQQQQTCIDNEASCYNLGGQYSNTELTHTFYKSAILLLDMYLRETFPKVPNGVCGSTVKKRRGKTEKILNVYK